MREISSLGRRILKTKNRGDGDAALAVEGEVARCRAYDVAGVKGPWPTCLPTAAVQGWWQRCSRHAGRRGCGPG